MNVKPAHCSGWRWIGYCYRAYSNSLLLHLAQRNPKRKAGKKKRAPEIELQQLQMFEQCQETGPRVAIFVFSLLQMIAPISWWCTPPGRGGWMYTEAGLNTCRLFMYSEKLPFLQVNNLSRRYSSCLFFSSLLSLTRLAPPWESLLLKIFIPSSFFLPPLLLLN